MSRLVSTYQRNESIKKIAVMAITALTSAVGLNFFLIPAKVFFGRDERNCANHCYIIIYKFRNPY